MHNVEIPGFSVIQILREINSGESRSSKTVIIGLRIFIFMYFGTFGRLKFNKLAFFGASKKVKNSSFRTSRISEIDFT